MRKNAKYILVSLLSFCFAVNVNAAECSYEKQVELNNIASTVKATYEAVDIDTGKTVSYVDEYGIIDTDRQVPVKEKGFNVKILNLTENLSIKVTNETEGTTNYYYYSDSDNGTITLSSKVADRIYTYTITVYGTKDSCEGIELRSLNLITPKYNTYSDYSFCKEYPNFDYCQEYVVDDSFNLEDFINKSAAYKETQDSKNSKDNQKDKNNNKSNFFKENKKLLIVCGSIILIVGVTTTVIIIIRKRSRLI